MKIFILLMIFCSLANAAGKDEFCQEIAKDTERMAIYRFDKGMPKEDWEYVIKLMDTNDSGEYFFRKVLDYIYSQKSKNDLYPAVSVEHGKFDKSTIWNKVYLNCLRWAKE